MVNAGAVIFFLFESYHHLLSKLVESPLPRLNNLIL